eukprot:178508-Rhodomonas_salina.1
MKRCSNVSTAALQSLHLVDHEPPWFRETTVAVRKQKLRARAWRRSRIASSGSVGSARTRPSISLPLSSLSVKSVLRASEKFRSHSACFCPTNRLACLSTVGVQVATCRSGNEEEAVEWRAIGKVSRSQSLSS